MKTDYQKFLCACGACGASTSKKYARANGGKCKECVTGEPKRAERNETDTYHDYIASGARAAGVSFSDC